MFNNQSKLFKKRGHNLITTQEIGVQNIKRFVLKNEESIIYKRDDRNQIF